ncbi:PREDICTED: DNA repair protein XRCC3-like isoform X3 [Trachymyrmex septentrionalis]|uniref:DNA repair protein XRCC3-like isoform X3 n=1 Tax=Trachymyrmex septentrionalis TaxID=34720 RepID=UPI00084F6D64|nr:PREDICTED: DNA repair protein XRCC3-like isoform X3 [Trachymyrmex septentrionalis]
MLDAVIDAASIKDRFLTTGCSRLDAKLGGGIPCRGITQLYGAAGTGKTQLALQLCLTVQLPITTGGLGAETTFPSKRLQQLLTKSEIAKTHSVNGDVILVGHIATSEELVLCLQRRVPVLMNTRKIGLLIIDSIAAPYRVEDWNDELQCRTKRSIGRQLHKLCKNDDLCVICINQVSAVIDGHRLISEGANEQPALGLAWSSMITTSIYFYRRLSSRYACVMLASHLPRITFQFEVEESGVKATE